MIVGTQQVQPRRCQWERWQHDEPSLARFTYDELRAMLQPGAAERVDQDWLLAALVRIANNDPDAVAVLVDCLRPGLAARVRQYGRGLDPGDAWGILTLSLVEQIARYDTITHPAFVARRLLWVPTRELKRTAVAAREQDVRQVPLDDADPAQAAGNDGGHDLAAGLLLDGAAEAGVISPRSALLLHHVHICGEPIATAAARCDIGYEAAKKAVQRSHRRLAAWWTADARPPRSSRNHRPRPRPAHRHPTRSGDT